MKNNKDNKFVHDLVSQDVFDNFNLYIFDNC